MSRSWLNLLKIRAEQWVSVPERLYIVIALIGVVGFALITPPFQGPDEKSHYIRTQYVANGYVLPVDAKKVGAYLPASIENVVQSTYLKDSKSGGMQKYDIRDSYRAAKIPLDQDGTYQPPMISYTAIPYLPAAPVVAAINALNLSPIVSFYAARFTLALFCVALTFFAIKIVPYKKYLFVAVALTPMLLFQQAVVSADGISYALLLYFICFVLYLRNNQTVTTRQLLVVGGLSVAITLAKPLVFLFLPFILVLAKDRAAKLRIFIIAMLCIALYAGVNLYNSQRTEVVVDSKLPESVNSGLQLENITENPKRFPRVMWNSYMTSYGDEETHGVIGIFGSADTGYPLGVTFMYVVVLGYLAAIRFKKNDEDNSAVPKTMKLLLIFLAAVYFLLVNIAIYLSFTPVNFNIVYGVQGRYFLPVLIIAPLFTAPFLTVIKKYQYKVLLYIGVVLLLLILAALFVTLQRYYLYTP